MIKLAPLLFWTAFFVSANRCQEPVCEEKPKENCMCTQQYEPVCGCNDKTYGNACEAECKGIKEYKAGACE